MATFWQWADTYEDAYNSPTDLTQIACPNCGHHTLRLVFTGDSQEMVGYATFWCDHCHQGIGISRTAIPPNGVLRDINDRPEDRRPPIPGDIRLVPPTTPTD